VDKKALVKRGSDGRHSQVNCDCFDFAVVREERSHKSIIRPYKENALSNGPMVQCFNGLRPFACNR
jgi:hypothetical protein